jgi:hypothetical protein
MALIDPNHSYKIMFHHQLVPLKQKKDLKMKFLTIELLVIKLHIWKYRIASKEKRKN